MKFARAFPMVLSVVLAACTAAPSTSSPSGTAALTTVTTSYQTIVSLGPMFVAEDQGFFKQYGIANKWVFVSSAYDVIPLQSQGVIDVNSSLGTGAAWFNAVNSGLKVHAVAGRLRYSCSSDGALYVRTALWNSGARTPADMKGKKVAVLSKGSATQYWIDLLLAKSGMTEADLGSLVTLSYPDTVNAFKSGAVDFAILGQPLAAQAVLDGTVKTVIPVHQILPDEELGFVGLSDEFLAKDGGSTAANWLAAFIKGIRYYEDPANKDSVISSIAKWTKVDPSVLSAIYGTDAWPWSDPNAELNTASVLNDAKWQADQKLIEKVPPADVWYNSGPLNAALQKVGKTAVNRSCSSVPQFAGK